MEINSTCKASFGMMRIDERIGRVWINGGLSVIDERMDLAGGNLNQQWPCTVSALLSNIANVALTLIY